MRDEFGARVVQGRREPTNRVRVVDDEPQGVAAGSVLAEDDLDDIVCRMHVGGHEQHDGGDYVDDTRRTPQYQTLWEQQKAAAMGPEQTRRFLLNLARSS